MKPLIFELVSEGTWKAKTPFGVNYIVLDHGSNATMLAPSGTSTKSNDTYDAMETARVDFEERTLECLGASEALRRTNDTIRKAERITRANPSLANLFEDLLQLARVREASTALATARNDALEEAKQAVIRFGKQNKMPGEIPYERAVAAEDIADIIEALKSETQS